MPQKKKCCWIFMLAVFLGSVFVWNGQAAAGAAKVEEKVIETTAQTNTGYEDLLEKDEKAIEKEQAPASEHPVAAKPKDHPAH